MNNFPTVSCFFIFFVYGWGRSTAFLVELKPGVSTSTTTTTLLVAKTGKDQKGSSHTRDMSAAPSTCLLALLGCLEKKGGKNYIFSYLYCYGLIPCWMWTPSFFQMPAPPSSGGSNSPEGIGTIVAGTGRQVFQNTVLNVYSFQYEILFGSTQCFTNRQRISSVPWKCKVNCTR